MYLLTRFFRPFFSVEQITCQEQLRQDFGEFPPTPLRCESLTGEFNVVRTCVEAMLEILSLSDDDPVAVAELVCIVDREDVGLKVTQLLRDRRIRVIHTFGQGKAGKGKEEDGRRKKLAFYRGDARVKVTTIQSFKGWESRALVVQISNVSDAKGLALAYVAITRLKRDDRGCFLTVVCSAPQLREFGTTWPLK